jgi:osmotically-inducible protein OsmY
MKTIALLLVVSCLIFGASCSQDKEMPSSRPPDALASTDPLDQGNTEADIQITSSIRKSVVSDKSLSTNAQNIKIMTSAGKVTLRGPVKNEHEKSKIEAYAKLANGVESVDNMLEVEKNP